MNSSSGIAAGSSCRPPQPTLLTSVEIPPKASTVAATTASIAALSVTSQAMPRQSFPVASAISAAVFSAISPLRSAIITLAPAPESVLAIPAPMFWAPPVMMTVWPVMRNSAKAS
jgi:hypothetical protein